MTYNMTYKEEVRERLNAIDSRMKAIDFDLTKLNARLDSINHKLNQILVKNIDESCKEEKSEEDEVMEIFENMLKDLENVRVTIIKDKK